ncbi:uncharacterized protein [Ptychodera flava]|uniref:uncharacterized protein n=1 Tax=Ptychodera flava TaxID=63121 RepID=UPI00396A314D
MAVKRDLFSDSLRNVPDDISVCYLPNFQNLSKKSQEKGLNYFSQGYVHDIKINDHNATEVNIIARCWRSMRKSELPHNIDISISTAERKLANANCSCKAGLSGHCSHVIGLLKSLQGLKLHNFTSVPTQLSCTSIPQQWHVPRGPKIKPVPLNHVVVARQVAQSRRRRPIVCHIDPDRKLPNVTPEDIGVLQGIKGTPLEYTLSQDAPVTQSPFGEVQLGSILSYQMKNMKTTKPLNGCECGPSLFPIQHLSSFQQNFKA